MLKNLAHWPLDGKRLRVVKCAQKQMRFTVPFLSLVRHGGSAFGAKPTGYAGRAADSAARLAQPLDLFVQEAGESRKYRAGIITTIRTMANSNKFRFACGHEPHSAAPAMSRIFQGCHAR